MPTHIRFGQYLRAVRMQNIEVSYQKLMPKPQVDSRGQEIPYRPAKLTLRPMDIYRLLAPYIGTRFWDQFRAVAPLAAYLAIFQWLVLRQTVSRALTIGAGLFAVLLGLMFFMEGLKLGLMPFGESIGNQLPKKIKLGGVLAIAFLLGVGVTFAEPAIGALQVAGSIVNPQQAPYLYLLLTSWSGGLVLVVGAGVGLAAVLGILRFIYGWSLKPLIYWTLIPALAITLYAHLNPELSKVVGLAWDCGGVTTGPVTVPLVLSLGIGVAAAVARGSSSLAGFGIVTLASILPVFMVMLLGIASGFILTPAEIMAGAEAARTAALGTVPAWYQTSPGQEIIMGLRAIVPLILFLFVVQKWLLKAHFREVGALRYGLTLAVVGMIIFNLGLTYGLSLLGSQAGGLMPGAFTQVANLAGSPLYSFAVGIGLAVLFAWLLGFGATLAEPALNALGMTVENLTSGAFKKSLLLYAVSTGVAIGIAVGILKIIFNLPLTYILLAAYGLALFLTMLSSEEYVNVAWDSAGVTTGPVTVPLVLAMGLGFGRAVGAVEGFGILAAASVFPILSVMSVGLYVQYRARHRNLKAPKGSELMEGAILE